MIQIYSPTNTNYTHNGDQTLFPSAATVHAILNGSWTAELTHPIDADGRWKSIVKDAVVKMPSFNGDQLFRIKSTSKSDSGVTAAMEPIFMDSMGDCFLVDIRPTAKNGQQALNDMVSPNSKYSASSDIARSATAYYEYKNLIEAIAGDDDNAFLKRWGGEILYDNFTVIVNERVGGDYGVEVRYGKNIPQDGVTEEVDTSAIITRIYPKAYNGYTMTNHGHVDSPLINSYPTIKAATLTFDDVKMTTDAQEDDAENGVIICNSQAELDQALTQRCQEQYDAGLDKPTVSLDISMVLLQNTEQYKDYQILETVSLGDTIHCRDSHLDITSDARVIELEYDSIQKRVSSVVIGDVQYNYFDQVTDSTNRIEQVIRPNGTLMAERVQGILNGIYTQLRLQSTAAQKVNGSAFLVEDTDPESALYGAMVWGTQGLQLSVVRTSDGRSWDWTTAVTAKGIVADAIVTGILSDKEGKNYWNLDTGEFRLSAESFLVDDETVQNYVDGAIDNKIAQIRELTVQLSNEVTLVPTSADGSGGNYSEAYTDVSVYLGTSDVSAAAQITVAVSAGVTGSWNPSQRRYSVTYLESDVGAVTFTVTYSGLQMSKTFTVAKSKQGQTGAQGIPGPAGDNGQTFYTWIKYADTPTSGMSDSPDGKEYMGIAYNKTTPAESTNYSDYQWSLIKGSDGAQGVPGPPGEDGQTLYTWIKYATSATGANMSDDPDGKTYLGIAYNKTTAVESNNPADYTWAFFEGPQGEKGDQGIPGPAGEDGQTFYTWIKYADTPTSGMSDNPDGKEYMGIAYNKTSQTESSNYSDYQWSLIKGANGSQGIPGPAGEDGKTLYTWIKYADTPTSGMSDNPDGKEYMGIAYNKTTPTESSNYSDYQWSLIKGTKGDQGIPGPQGSPGTNGKTSYFHVKYSSNSNGNPMTETPSTYIGTYVDFTEADSTNYQDYTWSRFQGAQGPQGNQGIPGTNGSNGQTSYLHIKYSNDGGATFTANNGETPGDYLGQYVDFAQTDSTDPDRYVWSLIKGSDGQNATTYILQADTLVIKQGADNAYNPPSVTFSAYLRFGDEAQRYAYGGRFVISESTNGTTYITKYTSAANETSHTYTPSAPNVKNIRCILYASGGTTSALDMQGVAIVRDIDNLKQEDVFNILTNNGVVQGIYLQNGQLYINAEYIAAGRIASVDGSSYWDLNTGRIELQGSISSLEWNGDQCFKMTVGSAFMQLSVYEGNPVSGTPYSQLISISRLVTDRYAGSIQVRRYSPNGDHEQTESLSIIGSNIEARSGGELTTIDGPGISTPLLDADQVSSPSIKATSGGSTQSTMTPTGVTTRNLSAQTATITGNLDAGSADVSGRVNADTFKGALVTRSGSNRFFVDWVNEGGTWKLYFYIDNQPVRTL